MKGKHRHCLISIIPSTQCSAIRLHTIRTVGSLSLLNRPVRIHVDGIINRVFRIVGWAPSRNRAFWIFATAVATAARRLGTFLIEIAAVGGGRGRVELASEKTLVAAHAIAAGVDVPRYQTGPYS